MRLEEFTVQQPEVFDVSKNRATKMGVDISHLRRAVFAEEMIRAGISPAAVHEHTRDWRAYDMAKALHNKVVEPDNHFVRAATHSGFVVGYCLGNMRREAGHKELSVVQLYPEVRRHELGSSGIVAYSEVCRI